MNNITSREDSARTDASGVAHLLLELGTYTVSASIQTVEFAFNGNSENLSINATNLSLEVSLVAVALKGGLVFKEIYYSGSRTPALAGYYSDQFHEIYNNSDQIIYLDGLCIGTLEPLGTTASVWIKTGCRWSRRGRSPPTMPLCWMGMCITSTPISKGRRWRVKSGRKR